MLDHKFQTHVRLLYVACGHGFQGQSFIHDPHTNCKLPALYHVFFSHLQAGNKVAISQMWPVPSPENK